MLYRIQTEDKNRLSVSRIVQRFFSGFTLIPTIGYWQGKKERSLIIEIDTEENVSHALQTIVRDIKTVNKQDAVLLSTLPAVSQVA